MGVLGLLRGQTRFRKNLADLAKDRRVHPGVLLNALHPPFSKEEIEASADLVRTFNKQHPRSDELKRRWAFYLDYVQQAIRSTISRFDLFKATERDLIAPIRIGMGWAAELALLFNPELDASVEDNFAIQHAAGYGMLGLVKLLLTYPEVNPMANSGNALLSQHIDIVKEFTKDSKTSGRLYCFGQAFNSACVKDRLDIMNELYSTGNLTRDDLGKMYLAFGLKTLLGLSRYDTLAKFLPAHRVAPECIAKALPLALCCSEAIVRLFINSLDITSESGVQTDDQQELFGKVIDADKLGS